MTEKKKKPALPATDADLRRQVKALEAEIAALKSSGEDDTRLEALEARLAALEPKAPAKEEPKAEPPRNGWPW